MRRRDGTSSFTQLQEKSFDSDLKIVFNLMPYLFVCVLVQFKHLTMEFA